jgi:alginate O-acetyltransferase complex protein AlgI
MDPNMAASLLKKLKQFLVFEQGKPMVFTDLDFWLFFFVFLIFYSFTYTNRRLKNAILLVFSLFFYYKSSGWATVLLLFVITQDFFIAKWIDRSNSKNSKKAFITLSVCSNLLVLGYFKYAYLLVDGLNSIFNLTIEKKNWLIDLIPANDLLQLDSSNILLPVGISFFIFHSLSYTIDVYRGIVKPLKSWGDYALFVSFFPELVAGPIVRARDFVDQLFLPYKVEKQMFGKGVSLILAGLAKKIILSDIISTQLVDRVFDSPEFASGPEAWFAFYGYGLQIFCDFSGYTDIAIGLALVLGFHLKPNFDQPYKSISITDFWRRWHISLSVWLRDYLYIPLGGNRKGNVRTYLNLLITMLLGGLWHGASWKFLIWGGMHGLALAIHKFWQTGYGKFSFSLPNSISWFITLHFALLCWLPFRAESVESALLLSNKLLLAWHLEVLPEIFQQYKLSLILLLAGFGIHFLPNSIKNFYTNWFEKIPVWLMGLVVVFSIFIIYQFKVAESQPFIYFQF